jgi:toxin HigB-1
VIKSFRDKTTAALFQGFRPKGIPAEIAERAARKLSWIDAATDLNDLRAPPSNMLEALRGDRRGQHSIRVNLQWRICFVWRGGDAHDVELCDYH